MIFKSHSVLGMMKHLTAHQDLHPKQLEKVSKIVKHLINSTGELWSQPRPEQPRSRRERRESQGDGPKFLYHFSWSWHVQYLVGIW